MIRSIPFFSRCLVLLLIGMANSLPLPFMGSLLSIWLAERGVDKSTIGCLSLASLPFALKIFWTPLIDYLSFPLAKHSPRKGWMVFALSGMAFSFLWLSCQHQGSSYLELVMCLMALSLFCGCFYVTGIAYEIESLQADQYSTGSAWVTTGYRLGLLFAGAGGLYLAAQFGWGAAHITAALFLFLIGVVVLILPEPALSLEVLGQKRAQFRSYPTYFHGFWQEVILQPLKGLFTLANWPLLVLVILSFKLGDNLLRSMVGPFYLSMGFSKTDLATAAKVWGLSATILGAFLTAGTIKKQDPFIAIGAISFLHACSLGCFYVLALYGGLPLLYVTIAIENFTGGMAITGFITFCWKVCDRRYAPIQYALLWSLFSLKSDLFAFMGSFLAARYEWEMFFLIATGLGIVSSLAMLCALFQTKLNHRLS